MIEQVVLLVNAEGLHIMDDLNRTKRQTPIVALREWAKVNGEEGESYRAATFDTETVTVTGKVNTLAESKPTQQGEGVTS